MSPTSEDDDDDDDDNLVADDDEDFALIDIEEAPPMTARDHRLIEQTKNSLLPDGGPLDYGAVRRVWCEAAALVPIILGIGITLALLAWLIV